MEKYVLKDLISVKRGMSLSGEYYSTEGDLIRLTLGNFQEEGGFKINTSKDDLYFTGPVKDEFILAEGDIITPLTEQVVGLLGATARIPESGKYIQSGDVALIKCISDKIDDGYCYYLISSDVARKQLSAAAQQTKIRHTSPEKIMDCEVFIPEVKEQRKVAKLLDGINKKIELNNKINDNLCEQIQLLYLYLFNHPSVPERWNKGVLSDIADITMGQSPAGDSYNDAGKGVPFYQGSTDFGTHFPSIRMYTTKPSRYASVADTLLSVRAPVGSLNTAFEDCCIGRGLAAIHGKHNNNTFVRYTLKNNKWYFDNINNSGTTFGSITKDYLYGMPVIIPDSESILVFERQASLMERQIYDNEQQSRELQGLRDWLLPMLMSGQATIAD